MSTRYTNRLVGQSITYTSHTLYVVKIHYLTHSPTVVENHNQNNIEILPQHRIYPNNSPINLIPFPIAIHHARDIRAAADLQKIKENC
jgi:hypothetical protein